MVADLPDAAATDARVADLRRAAEAAQNALAEVRAEAATHARAVSADKQRSEAALKEAADWRVRAELAGIITSMPREVAEGRLRGMLTDDDKRVQASALRAFDIPSAPRYILNVRGKGYLLSPVGE